MAVAGARTSERRPGRLASWTAGGRSLLATYEEGAALAATALAPGVVRVSLARNGVFAPRRSWAVTRPDETYPETLVEAGYGRRCRNCWNSSA
jgi:hypothetical protein